MTETMQDQRPVVFTEPTSRKVSLTPALAMEFLARSDLNRLLSRDRAADLAASFQRGEYRITGDSIVFNRYGFMTNGQHRCLAVVIADLAADGIAPDGRPYADIYPGYSVADGFIGLPIWVMEGADDDEIMVQDTGRPRSFSDHLRIKGVTNAAGIAGATKLLWNYDRGIIQDMKTWRSRLTPTVFQLDDFISTREPLIREGLKRADRVRHKLPLNTSVLTVAWIVLSRIDETDAEGFWDEISMKTPPSDGVNLLVRQVLHNSTSRKTSKTRQTTGWYNTFDARHQMALIIKTWNSYRSGNTPQNLIFRSGGVAPEAFPEPR